MTRFIAMLCGVSLLLQPTVAAADPGPLLKASLAKHPERLLRAEARATGRPNAGQNDDQNTGNWMERHPVWTGAIVGFSAGFLLTYAVAASEDHSHQLFTPVDPGGPALVWGGIVGGVGALAGWGIGRSRDKDANPVPDSTDSALADQSAVKALK